MIAELLVYPMSLGRCCVTPHGRDLDPSMLGWGCGSPQLPPLLVWGAQGASLRMAHERHP